MSLVGSLEDLALADILQIVSLSRKSGLLLLRCEGGEGRIVFCDGLVWAAYVKGEPEDLTELLVRDGFAPGDAPQQAAEDAYRRGISVDEAIAELAGLSSERIDSVCREHVERAVLRMFGWRAGEFSFEVRDQIDPRDEPLLLRTGINAQFLTIEATRLGDEGAFDIGSDADPEADLLQVDADEEPVFSGDFEDCPAPDRAPVEEIEEPRALEESPATAAGDPVHIVAAASQGMLVELDAAPVAPESAATPAGRPLVVVDPDLRTLEWLKDTLAGLFGRIHIFQRTEDGVARIRQYLSRAELPVVLLSAEAQGDPMVDVDDIAALIPRLRAQAPAMGILIMCDAAREPATGFDAADAIVRRPGGDAAAEDPWGEGDARSALREQLRPWAERPSNPVATAAARARGSAADPPSGTLSAASLARLKEMSGRLRDPGTRGEVLTVVLEFAAECFSRVAMFMVQDDRVVGIAQIGLDRAGGPDDEALRRIELAADEPAWFRAVIEHREALRGPVTNSGDRRLVALLGPAMPSEAYVAPIESGDTVVGLLYADNLPDEEPLPDTDALAIVLHEAGLALDRALLERALAEAEEGAGRRTLG